MDVQAPPERRAASAPLISPVQSFLERLHAAHVEERGGEVASYIPELAGADPEWFGICLVTVDGAVYEVGDTRRPFTLQSISKPLTYGLVLDELSPAAVAERVGVEPTGDAFNGIALEPGRGRPQNPMVNAGAITMSGLVRARDGRTPIERLLETYGRYAGRALAVDGAVSRSEAATGHRNRAIAHLLRGAGMLDGDPERVLDVYFDQCAVTVDARDLAMIAASLAAGGVNPCTGERAASEDAVRTVLSVMSSCGMYDSAGEWLCSVGLPAKSGVSGGILAVLPGQLGIGVFSPPLDRQGNSVRGIRVCQSLSRELRLHLVQSGRPPGPAIRAAYTLANRGSKRARSEVELVALAADGGRSRVLELQGDLGFAAVEGILRALAGDGVDRRLVVLDLRAGDPRRPGGRAAAGRARREPRRGPGTARPRGRPPACTAGARPPSCSRSSTTRSSGARPGCSPRPASPPSRCTSRSSDTSWWPVSTRSAWIACASCSRPAGSRRGSRSSAPATPPTSSCCWCAATSASRSGCRADSGAGLRPAPPGW